MRSNPKIIVLKTREIIYTLLLLALVALLIVCLVLMFSGKKTSSSTNEPFSLDPPEKQNTVSQEKTGDGDASPEAACYTPGVYSSPVTLGDSTVDVEVTVDDNHINSIRLVSLNEATEAAFPLVSPSLTHITSQILEKQSLEGITCSSENRYTSQLLLSAISDALALAEKKGGSD